MAQQDASNELANILLDSITVIRVGLSSSAPNRTAPTYNITPPAQADYVRASPTFAAAATRKRLTTTIANFVNGGGAAAANGGNFGWATFHDNTVGGTFLGSCQLSQPVAWTAGLGVTMAAGDVSVEFEAS